MVMLCRISRLTGARGVTRGLCRGIGQKRLYSANGGNTSGGKSVGFFVAGAAVAGGAFWLTKKEEKKKVVENGSQFGAESTSTSPLASLTAPKYGTAAEQKQAFKEIVDYIGEENTTTSKDTLDDHSDTYWSTHHAKDDERPSLVVYPGSTEDVSAIVKIAHKYRIPVTPFSGGTSLEGHFTPSFGGVCLDFTRMDQIIAIHKEDLDCVVQPAVGWESLNEVLDDYELMFGPDPGPGAQIGGMIGTSCSGTNAARYGTMRDNVLNLTVVMADGTVIKTRQRPRKSSAGYNLTGMFVGSEGTLGIVTEATLKLHPKPKNLSVGVVSFNTIKDAANVVAEVVQRGLQVGAVELLDDEQLRAINKAGTTGRTWKETPTLFFKFAGTEAMVEDQIKHVGEISKEHGSTDFDFARDETEREELWSARKHALWSAIECQPKGYHAWTTDVAVPVSRMAEIVSDTKQDIVKNGLFATIVGHVGDGNFHAIIVYDPKTQRKTTEEVVDRMVKRALEAEGTCTGEHGVGIGKKGYLEHEIGVPAVDAMRRLKKAFDPLSILNPDKVITVNPDHIEEHN